MHSPHFTQRLRNSFSSSEPGGLINLDSENPDKESGVDLIRGTAVIP